MKDFSAVAKHRSNSTRPAFYSLDFNSQKYEYYDFAAFARIRLTFNMACLWFDPTSIHHHDSAKFKESLEEFDLDMILK